MTRDVDIELIVRIVLRVLDDSTAAVPSPRRLPRRGAAGPLLRLATERDVLAAEPAGVLQLARAPSSRRWRARRPRPRACGWWVG